MIKLGNIKYETIAPTKEQLIIYVPAGTYLCDLYTNLGSIPKGDSKGDGSFILGAVMVGVIWLIFGRGKRLNNESNESAGVEPPSI